MRELQKEQLTEETETGFHRDDGTEYKRITLEDWQWMNPLITTEGGLATDNCFGTYYLWGDAFGLRIAAKGMRLLAYCGTGSQIRFYYPHGTGSLKDAVLCMEKTAREHQADLEISGVTREQKEMLAHSMPGYFTFKEKRSRADYIYDVESLASLAGKKLHSKKNHCNRFEREYPDWHWEILEEKHMKDCLALLSKWEDHHQEGQDDEMQQAEQNAVVKSFQHYHALHMAGIALYAGKTLAGFSFGEPIGKLGFDVHFEKADTEIHGAYAMVNREMARMIQRNYPDIKFVNREEDMGLENLQKAKESYRPAFLIEKYSACHPTGLGI
ncbi:MAG: DUF2156 domain-containing protein [Lachnospiraceae bacterium]|jgi:hypothetical protein|nr:DUF2156 domain-containing protein [Lachnospiraceae bacterium]